MASNPDRAPSSSLRTTRECTPAGTVMIAIAFLALFASMFVADFRAQLAAGMLLAPLLVDLLVKPLGLPRIALRVGSRRTWPGVPFVETVVVTNESRRVARDVRLQELQTGLHCEPALLGALAPGSSATLELSLRCRLRGRARQRRFLLESTWPFGFVRVRAELLLDAELVVEPARVPVPPAAEPARLLAQSELQHEPFVTGLEFYALREYQPGDDLRHVHALRSAATGILQRQDLRDADVNDATLVLDLRAAQGVREPRGGRLFEWALGVAATLIDASRRSGPPLECIVLADETVRTSVVGEDAAADLLALLADARPVRHRPLTDATLFSLRELPRCLWLAAAGNRAEPERIGVRAQLLEEGT